MGASARRGRKRSGRCGCRSSRASRGGPWSDMPHRAAVDAPRWRIKGYGNGIILVVTNGNGCIAPTARIEWSEPTTACERLPGMEHCNPSLSGSRRQALMINLTGNGSTFSSAAPCGFSASFKRSRVVSALTPSWQPTPTTDTAVTASKVDLLSISWVLAREPVLPLSGRFEKAGRKAV